MPVSFLTTRNLSKYCCVSPGGHSLQGDPLGCSDSSPWDRDRSELSRSGETDEYGTKDVGGRQDEGGLGGGGEERSKG